MEHRLYMQAFTAMRELIGSIGLIPIEKACTNSAEGTKQRTKAKIFASMIQYPETEWKFSGDRQKPQQRLLPFYNELERFGLVDELRSFARDLIKCRNGFDHGWTGAASMDEDIPKPGERYLDAIERALQSLKDVDILTTAVLLTRSDETCNFYVIC